MPGPGMIINAVKAQILQKRTGITARENAMMAYNHQTPQWIPCVYTDFWLLQPKMEGERYCGHEVGTDWFGVEWTYEPKTGAPMPTQGKQLFDDIADWKKYVHFPDLDAIDWEKQAEEDLRTDLVASLSAGHRIYTKNGKSIVDPNKPGIAMVLNGMFERMHAFMGFENALMALSSDPENCAEYFAAMADYKIKFFRIIGKYYPVQIINAHDDYGFKRSMLMSPDTWRELIKPNLKRMVDAVHEMGLKYQHHSCGYIEPIIPDLVEIGVDALDPLQVCNTNIRALKDQYQDRLTFVGGEDNQDVLEQLGCTVAQQKAEYDRAVNLLAPGGSYVAFPHVADFSLIPTQIEEHFRYGVPFYQKQKAV
ncbi:MAG: hypothetical protein IKT07_07485 [Oscillospiraceae bacterium]|nr:hypothetical protein [Oscillospiraceae bacterium]